ncbi:MAG: glycerophosphodiester phosphodiesterase [Caulobacteraceae bacterium]
MSGKEHLYEGPLVYAHRGASGYAPENTMAAFKKAVELGSHGIECDVQLTKDGWLVVCHDETVDRTTNGKGFIKDMKLADIRRLDAGSWFGKEFKNERIPFFSELLELVKKTGLLLNVEIKSGIILYPGIEKKVMDEVTAFGLQDRVIISSFNHYSVNTVKQIAPVVKTGILYMEGLFEPWNYMKAVGCECAHPFYMALKPEIAKELKARGFMINVFTVNDPNHAKELAEMGVDIIITNYPDKILDVLKNNGGSVQGG